jgi:anaerobic magnesium-protoporphyrin IX monomethyl ester cyclase
LVGGPYINIEPEIIVPMNADYAIMGDAELSIAGFCRAVIEQQEPDKTLPGLVWKTPEGIKKNEPAIFPNLSELPLPAYHLLNINKYRSANFNLRTISMITARGGCPYTCNFCGNLMKERYRFLDPGYVCDQIEEVIEKYQTAFIEFVDETFTLNKFKAADLCNEIIRRGIKIKWACLTRVDKLDEQLIELMYRAGCRLIRFGVESGNERVRYISDKRISNQRYIDIIALCKKQGIKVLCFYIFGHPTETIEEMNETLEFSFKLPSDTITYSRMEPIPNSALFEQALAEKKISRDVWTQYMFGKAQHPIYYPDTVNPEDMEAIYKKAFFRYYTSARALKNFAPQFISPGFWSRAFNFIKIIAGGEKNLP